ncbi:extracellular solute-binding protein [Georgenia halophila]|uniref:Extracellular solute-binding protein n=1 Tax=Georgenia halophila TaxID=620889 RepID=A0ABP8LKV0_9MICO
MTRPVTISRRALLAGAGGLGLGALGGCVQGSATRSSGDGLSLWMTFSSSTQRDYFRRTFVDAFNTQHDGAPLRLTIRGDGDSLQRLQRTAIASGSGPDLIYTAGPSYGLEFVQAGKFRALDEYSRQYGWEEVLQPWAYGAGVLGGTSYMIPTSYETMIMVYNARTFEEHGWTVPTTRAEFEEYASAAAAAGVMPVAIGNADWAATTEWLVSIFFNHAAGPEVIHQALTGEIPWTDQRIVDAVALLKDYFDRGWMGGGTQAYFTNREAQLWAKLVDGSAGVYFVGSWAFTSMAPYFSTEAGNYDDWDWAPIPAFGDETTRDLYAIGVGSTYSINADSPRQDDAAAYIDFLLSDRAAQMQAVAEVQSQPIPLEYRPDDYPGGMDPRIRRLYDGVTEAERIGYLTWTFWPPRSDVYIYEEMDRVITGQLTPEAYCAGLDELFRTEAEQGKVPPTPEPVIA